MGLKKTYCIAIGEFLILSILALLPVALVYIDIAIIGHTISETSVTELTQEGLLLVTALIFFYGAWRHRSSRGFLLLLAGFFTCALIREMDGFLDAVWHGFWFWPSVIVALSTLVYVVLCCRNSVVGPMSNFLATRPYFYIIMGLVVVLVFSRTFGSGNLLWKDLLKAAYTSAFVAALQEGLELLGYLFIAFGSFIFLSERFNS